MCACVCACVKCKTSTIQPFEIANKIDAYTKFDDTVSMRNVLHINDGNFYSTRFLRLFFPFTSFNDPSPLNDYVRRQVCLVVCYGEGAISNIFANDFGNVTIFISSKKVA